MEQDTKWGTEQRSRPAEGIRGTGTNRGRRKSIRTVAIAVLVTVVLQTGLVALLLGRDGRALMEGYLLARFAFIEADADLSAGVDRALEGLVAGLEDRWSYYRNREGHEELRQIRANNYVGIGIAVTQDREEGIFVQDVTAGGPAEQSGVRPGDIIIAIDGEDVSGEKRYEGVEHIGGEEGTSVELTLLGEDGSIRVLTCVRATLRASSATGQMLEGQVGHVYLANFYTGAAESFREEVDALLEQGAKALIVDLRSDPGGYISELKDILDYLLPAGPVFREQSRWWKETVYESDEAHVNLPMVTLVNAHSYSAAELLAAQLKESVGAQVVGEQTSGKGYSQITFQLSNGGGLGLSVARYCLGSGRSLIGTGIVPDVEVALGQEGDAQLEAALKLLKNGI